MRKKLKSSIQFRPSKKLGDRYQASVTMPDGSMEFDTYSTREEAEQFIADMEAKYKAECKELEAHKAVLSAGPPTASVGMEGERLSQILKDFAESVECKPRHKSLMNTLEKLIADPTIGQLAPSWIKKYIARVRKTDSTRGRPYSLESIASQLSVIGVAIKWKAEELDIQPRAFIVKDKYFMDVARSEGMDMPNGTWRKERNRRLEEGEEQRLLDEIGKVSGEKGEQWKQLFQWAIATAGRQKELTLAKWSDISPAGLTWSVPHYKTKARAVTLTDEAQQVLESLRAAAKPDEKLIFAAVGKPATVSKDFREIVKQAGIEDLRFHDLRHEAISRLVLSQTMQPDRLMKMVGHQSQRMTDLYTNIREHEIERLMVRNRKANTGPANAASAQPSGGEGASNAASDQRTEP